MATTTSGAGMIKEARQKLGLTQEKLARALKVSFPTVNRWENGKTQPDERARHALAALLRARNPEFTALADGIDGGEESTTAAERPKRGRRPRSADTALPTDSTTLDSKSMEGMLWKAACSIRGEKDAPKFKDYILPLLFLKRLSDVFEDEVARLAETYGDADTALSVLEADHSLVRFFIPEVATWPVLAGRKQVDWPAGKAPKTLGERLTNAVRAVARANPSLQGVVDIVDFNETRNGEREMSEEALHRIIELFSEPRYRLGLKDVEADFLGRAYEYLLRKFAEGQGQSAGEFFTPKEVGWLIANLVEPQQGEEIYDYACGSAGLLIKCELRLLQREKTVTRPLKLYGQELTGSSFAIARMNMVLHDMDGEIVRGNTMTNPKFLNGSRLRRFDVVVANPMWNQDNIELSIYESDSYERFANGYAPASSADWAWLEHTVASLNDSGRAAVVLDTGAVSRGSGSHGDNKEKAIRKTFVENDWIEAVVFLPENLFYNTPAPGLIIMLNRLKAPDRRNTVLLIRAADQCVREKPKNVLHPSGIQKIAEVFHRHQEVPGFSRKVALSDIIANDYNLAPSAYIAEQFKADHGEPHLLLAEMDSLVAERALTISGLKSSLSSIGFTSSAQGEDAAKVSPPVDLVDASTWPSVALGDLLTLSQYGLSVRGALEGQYPILRMNCQQTGRVVFRDLQYVSLENRVFEAYRLHDGDILFNRTNSYELVGRTAMFLGTRPAVFASYLVRIRVNPDKVLPAYLNYYLNLERTQAALKSLATRGVSQSNISASKLKTFLVSLPPLAAQRTIVDALDLIGAHVAASADYVTAVEALNTAVAHLIIPSAITS
jgi:type I restriction enzyme M protein